MKKSFLLLPLAAFVLAGCSNSSDSSAVETVDAGATSTYGGSWQAADIQPTAMPASMSGSVSTPSYSSSQTVQHMPQPVSQPTYASYGQSETVGSCNVVRDGSGKPDYTQIQKGCYTDSTYTVGKQDTLFLIGYLTGQGANRIASLNGLSVSNPQLSVGQTLRVR